MRCVLSGVDGECRLKRCFVDERLLTRSASFDSVTMLSRNRREQVRCLQQQLLQRGPRIIFLMMSSDKTYEGSCLVKNIRTFIYRSANPIKDPSTPNMLPALVVSCQRHAASFNIMTSCVYLFPNTAYQRLCFICFYFKMRIEISELCNK